MRKLGDIVNRGKLRVIFFRLARERGYSFHLSWQFARVSMKKLDEFVEELDAEVKREDL